MPFVSATNVCAVELVYQQEGQIIENVFHVQFPALPTTTSMNTIASGFKDWFSTSLKEHVVNACSLIKIRVTDQTTVTSGGVEYVSGLPIAGTAGVQGSPMNVTIAIKWLTGIRGRSYRGRTYHVGLSEADYVGSVLGAAQLAALVTSYSALITDISGIAGGYSLVVLSRVSGKAPRISAVATIISSVAIDSTLDSQRRRLPGRGR